MNENLSPAEEGNASDSPKASKRFDSAVLIAIHDGLLVLGEKVRHVIYYYLETHYQVKHEEIPGRLEAFHKALQDIFGAGTETVEKVIAKNLYSSLELSFIEHKNWTLADYVKDAEKAVPHL